MRVVKPDKLSVLTRVFEHEGRPRLVLSLLCGFSFDRPRALASEVDLWTMAAEELAAEGGVLDEGNVKVRAEVLVTGKCFPPGGLPAAVSFVRLRFGAVDKRLAVMGTRRWSFGVPSEPEPFTEMPVDWEHAFGGPGFAPNPKGKGVRPVEVEGGEKVHELPNVENPRELIKAPGDRPEPAGFGPYDFTWPQRYRKVGTYDRKWLETRYPGYAADFDPTLFNTAPVDQQLEGYLTGGETFLVENMHPTRARIEGSLPDVVPRAFVTHRGPDGETAFREISMRLDTLRLVPHRAMGVLVFRGVLEIAEDDAEDVVDLVGALEAPGSPRSIEHYRGALALRLDKEKGALMALRNDDLMPPAAEGYVPSPEPTDIERWVKKEDLLAKNMRRRMEQEYAKARAQMVAQGFTDAELAELELPPEEPTTEAEDLDALVAMMDDAREKAATQKREAEQKKAELEAQARAEYAAMGLDYDEVVAKALKDDAGPPKFKAAQHLAWMKSLLATARSGGSPIEELEARVADPAYAEELARMERGLVDAYRRGVHARASAPTLDRERSALFRAELEVALHNEIALEARDYTGADLAGMDLRGIDLRGAFLESVDLTGTDLRGAKLAGAILAHATLRETKLQDADLSEANLGGARIERADLSGCRLHRAVLARTRIADSSLCRADWSGASLLEAELVGEVDLSESVGHDLMVLRLDCRALRLARADWAEAVLLECDLRGVDFTGANLTKVALLGCQLDGARFCEVLADKLQLLHGSTAVGADFGRARMAQVVARGVSLAGARFTGAMMDKADLSGADLRGANLDGARARSALMIRTRFGGASLIGCDLLGAIMQKSKLEGANFQGANLFAVDLAKARVDGQTNVDRANLTRSRQIPRAKDEP